ncbi:hypothetical protein ACFOVU_05305 [Nocardiopsis sediminis]|uniref:Uncharacterized protein n=1 Tax=Nocardiopsis sediminis TaxID=1778267 RepID=A0ABV8FIX2_9ACTN
MTPKTPAAVALPLVLLLGGCAAPADEAPADGAGAAPAPSATASPGGATEGPPDRGDRGGPVDAERDGDPILVVGGVRTHAIGNDTVELATMDPGAAEPGPGGGSSGSVEWTPRLTVTFTSAEREGDDVTFRGEASYLHDEGGYAVHSQDFTVLVPNGLPPEEAEGFADSFDAFTAEDSEVVAELSAGEPTAEFAVTIAGVPPEDGGESYDDGTYGRYVQYETPQEVWGYTVRPPQDYIPGRLCYVEGPSWHDVPLFEYTDVPCG